MNLGVNLYTVYNVNLFRKRDIGFDEQNKSLEAENLMTTLLEY